MPILFNKESSVDEWNEKLVEFIQRVVDNLDKFEIQSFCGNNSVRYSISLREGEITFLPKYIQIGVTRHLRSRFWGFGQPLISFFLFYSAQFELGKVNNNVDEVYSALVFRYVHDSKKKFPKRLKIFDWKRWIRLRDYLCDNFANSYVPMESSLNPALNSRAVDMKLAELVEALILRVGNQSDFQETLKIKV